MDSYPNGRFVRLARVYVSKLKNSIKPNNSKERNALKDEMADWDEAKKANTYDSYNDYLRRYPIGFFASVAEDYIDLLDTQMSIATYAKYAAEEDKYLLDNDRKLLAMTEQRLGNEEQARYKLAEKLLRLDVPSF
jgi:hypothetical protein